jgi:histidinol dehydrogenase
MRILKLTPRVEQQLLQARSQRDTQAQRIAARIIGDVRERGDAALHAWAKKLDGANLRRDGLWFTPQELRASSAQVSKDFRQATEHAAWNIRSVARKQLPQPWSLNVEPGVNISQLVRPIDAIGCYIPGGRFALVSTLLMTVVPAKLAGVKRIVVVCPRADAEVLYAAHFLGVTAVARIGGAQAIAALAYGTKSMERVDKIFGPGNRFVTAAKQLVSSDCAIDLPAGPTEAVVLATKGHPQFIAADLLAQAEHATDAGSFFVTTSRELAAQVQRAVAGQLASLPKTNPARVSIEKYGAILLAPSLDVACDFVNSFAPEHLSLPAASDSLLKKITAAGTIFVGPLGAQSLGDYASGSNHVLPTGGWARSRAGLSAADFVKCISVQSFDRRGFASLADDVITLANAEGLLAHANAIKVRQ